MSDDVARITALAVAPRAELHERGRTERHEVPRRAHAEWKPPPDRRSPLDILAESNASRVPELVPIRYGRMAANPFAYLRGAPAVMAADLARTPRTRIWPQICGDGHLSNFGVFGTPERSMIFDLNDFDETLPGPFEWDLKRLTASIVVAARAHGFGNQAGLDAAREAVRGYVYRIEQLPHGPRSTSGTPRPPRPTFSHSPRGEACNAGSRRTSPRPVGGTRCRQSPNSPGSSTAGR